jgi:zinc protease
VSSPLTPDSPAPLPRLRVRVRRVAGPPVVAIRLWAAGGARLEASPGQALVTGRLLEEGTRHRDWRRLAEDLEERGMNLASFGAFEGHGLSLDALAGDWDRALEWAAEVFLEASFPEERCSWITRQAAAELESLADEPEVRTSWAFLEQLYAPHPRQRPLQGDAASLARVRAEDCARFHADSLSRGVIAVVTGEIEEGAVERRVLSLFSRLQGEASGAHSPLAPVGLAERRREVTLPDCEQAHLYVGHLSVAARHPDFPALELLAVTLGSGAGLQGRIPERIREREGLAYAAHAQTVAGAGLEPGRLVAYVATAPELIPQAEQGVGEEIAQLAAAGVSTEELEEARSYLLGREPFRRESARQLADLAVEALHLQLPWDEPAQRAAALNACTLEQVNEAAARHVRFAELRTTVGMPSPADAPAG